LLQNLRRHNASNPNLIKDRHLEGISKVVILGDLGWRTIETVSRRNPDGSSLLLQKVELTADLMSIETYAISS